MTKANPKSSRPIKVSVVTPAFNEAQNLPLLYRRLKKSLDQLRLSWEWIVVDDHSEDETYRVMESIARNDKRVKVLRFERNSGSHLALACALREAKGACAVGMAADLQDPPETIGELYGKWKDGAKVVWAVRGAREGESFSTVFFARLYYFIVRYGVGLKQVPPTGADFFLLDKVVLKRLAQSQVRNASILLLICSFGYRQDFVTYSKRERVYGKSGWSLRKKFKLFFDSVTMFSKAPIYWALGAGVILLGFGGWMAGDQSRNAALLLGGYLTVLSGLISVVVATFLLVKTKILFSLELVPIEKRSDRK